MQWFRLYELKKGVSKRQVVKNLSSGMGTTATVGWAHEAGPGLGLGPNVGPTSMYAPSHEISTPERRTSVPTSLGSGSLRCD